VSRKNLRSNPDLSTTPEYEETNEIFGLFEGFFVTCEVFRIFEHFEKSPIFFGVPTEVKVGG
jgi:hypothetical protein